jgi:hypothetical protein
MDRFIALENIKHFRDRLWSETDASMRSRLHKLLVEEEDKLVKNLELLTDIERHLADGHRRIEKQRVLVAAMARDGHDHLATARALLDGMTETQRLHTEYRELTLAAIRQNRLA